MGSHGVHSVMVSVDQLLQQSYVTWLCHMARISGFPSAEVRTEPGQLGTQVVLHGHRLLPGRCPEGRQPGTGEPACNVIPLLQESPEKGSGLPSRVFSRAGRRWRSSLRPQFRVGILKMSAFKVESWLCTCVSAGSGSLKGMHQGFP